MARPRFQKVDDRRETVSSQCLLATVFFAVLLFPSLAAAAGADPLNFGSGVVSDMAHKVLGFARPWVVFAFILGLVLEMFGRAPGAPKNYAAVVWRLVIVTFLLAQYDFVFGSIKRSIDTATAQLAPAQGDFLNGVETLTHGLDTSDNAVKAQVASLKAQLSGAQGQYDVALAAQDSGATAKARELVGKLSSALKTADPGMWGSIGGFLFDTLATFIFLFAELAHLLVSRLGQLLAAAFYILGPLALVFSIPTFSRIGHAWFKRYVTYCCWPLFSAILLKLVLALLVGAKPPSVAAGQVAQNLFIAAMMILSALSVPHIAAELIGGSAANFMALGAAKAVAAARSMGHAVTGAVTGATKAKDAATEAAGAVKDKAAAAGAVVANAAVAPVANSAGLMQAMQAGAGSQLPAHLKDVTERDRPAAGRHAGGGAPGAVANIPPGPASPAHADTAGGRPRHQGNTTIRGRGDGAVALPANAPGDNERPPRPPPEAFEGHEDVTR